MRRGLICVTVFVALFLAVLVSPSLVCAAEHPEGEAGTGEHVIGPDTGATPHEGAARDPFKSIALDLTIWTIVVFVLLVLVLGKFAWKPMLEGLQKREQAIESAIEQAKKDQEEAAALRAQLQQELANLHEKVRATMDEAHRDAQATRDRMVSEAEAEIQAKRERADREIENDREQAQRDLWDQTAQLATLVATKAIRRNMNLDDHRNLVDEAVAEMNFSTDGASKA